MSKGCIGVFDSGYGGLTVLKAITARLPQYDYIYLGDNARAPYGTRSFDTVYHYTLQCVEWFFAQGCPLVILACNTASAKALRTIQQHDLPRMGDATRRILGVIRPTSEIIGQFSHTGHLGILATPGTVQSGSYPIEIEKFFPDMQVYQEACPLWVPLIENNEHKTPGALYFFEKNVRQLMAQSGKIDTVLLACTHYPLVMDELKGLLAPGTSILSQGGIVADSLADYLQRHPEMELRCTRGRQRQFFTTDATEDFDARAAVFYGQPVQSRHLALS
jgi:glutamate racemase